jgi:ribonuclease BN (tRNA processing enzyme)
MELLFPGSTSVQRRFALRVHEVGPGEQLKLDGCTVRTYPAQHQAGAPALSLRLEFNDRVVAYSGDTAWDETSIEVARGAAVFICEGYSLLRPVPFHLHLPLLREHLGELTCERLILTHPSPEVLAHARDLEFELADDNTTFEI